MPHPDHRHHQQEAQVSGRSHGSAPPSSSRSIPSTRSMTSATTRKMTLLHRGEGEEGVADQMQRLKLALPTATAAVPLPPSAAGGVPAVGGLSSHASASSSSGGIDVELEHAIGYSPVQGTLYYHPDGLHYIHTVGHLQLEPLPTLI